MQSPPVLNSVTTVTCPPLLCDYVIGTSNSSSQDDILAESSRVSFQDVLESMVDYRVSVAAWRYCPPVILTLGTVGNVMTLWVLGEPPGRTSSMPLYFTALALSDLTLLYTGLLRNWVKYAFHLDLRDTHPAVCKVHIFLVYVTGVTSAWFLIMMTTQRALSVLWPHKTRPLRSRRTAFVAIGVIVMLSCLLNAHNLYGYDLRYYPDYGRFYCDYLNPDYERFARGPWPWVDMALSSLLPFCLLLAGNSLLMWKVTSSVGDVKKLTSTGQGSREAVSQRRRMSTSLNLTLVILSATFFLLTSPVCLYLILDHYFRFDLMGDGSARHVAATHLGWALTNLLWYTNSAVNFYLYCLTGSRFRAQVWQCLCCVRWSAGEMKKGVGVVRATSVAIAQQPRHSPLSEGSESAFHM
ncbi:galanin receptor type 3-like [Babylonia areolata]|uniref:galanin receptor type 3-like n=1 Tax=Babylonia areolata TaxID=304850 RepID=UPI003FD09BB3